MSTITKDLYALGEAPPLGHVPPTMHAMTIRQNRFGAPQDAFQPEVVPVPEIGAREALVYVMAAGINYNNVWAALGTPVDVIKARAATGDTTGFHVGGSDASGIVYAVGDEVTNVIVGDLAQRLRRVKRGPEGVGQGGFGARFGHVLGLEAWLCGLGRGDGRERPSGSGGPSRVRRRPVGLR